MAGLRTVSVVICWPFPSLTLVLNFCPPPTNNLLSASLWGGKLSSGRQISLLHHWRWTGCWPPPADRRLVFLSWFSWQYCAKLQRKRVKQVFYFFYNQDCCKGSISYVVLRMEIQHDLLLNVSLECMYCLSMC